MAIEQTVEIPASHRLTIEVPREVPMGRTILTFTPIHGHSAHEKSEARGTHQPKRRKAQQGSPGRTFVLKS